MNSATDVDPNDVGPWAAEMGSQRSMTTTLVGHRPDVLDECALQADDGSDGEIGPRLEDFLGAERSFAVVDP